MEISLCGWLAEEQTNQQITIDFANTNLFSSNFLVLFVWTTKQRQGEQNFAVFLFIYWERRKSRVSITTIE